MNKSESIGQIAAALAAAQGEIKNPSRNREVSVKMKSGGTYKFKYATLDAILDAVRPALTKNGLWFTQTLANSDGKYRLVTTLLHASGEWLDSEQPLFVEENTNQAFGSALTYAKRYALTGMLGIAADEDDDVNAADGNTVTETKKRQPPPKTEADNKTEDMRAVFKDLRDRIRESPPPFLPALFEELAGQLAEVKAFSASAHKDLIAEFHKRGWKDAA